MRSARETLLRLLCAKDCATIVLKIFAVSGSLIYYAALKT
jgi:hypothetical protein